MKWKWNKNNPNTQFIYAEYDDDQEIVDFDLQPYLGWMEEELMHQSI